MKFPDNSVICNFCKEIIKENKAKSYIYYMSINKYVYGYVIHSYSTDVCCKKCFDKYINIETIPVKYDSSYKQWNFRCDWSGEKENVFIDSVLQIGLSLKEKQNLRKWIIKSRGIPKF